MPSTFHNILGHVTRNDPTNRLREPYVYVSTTEAIVWIPKINKWILTHLYKEITDPGDINQDIRLRFGIADFRFIETHRRSADRPGGRLAVLSDAKILEQITRFERDVIHPVNWLYPFGEQIEFLVFHPYRWSSDVKSLVHDAFYRAFPNHRPMVHIVELDQENQGDSRDYSTEFSCLNRSQHHSNINVYLKMRDALDPYFNVYSGTDPNFQVSRNQNHHTRNIENTQRVIAVLGNGSGWSGSGSFFLNLQYEVNQRANQVQSLAQNHQYCEYFSVSAYPYVSGYHGPYFNGYIREITVDNSSQNAGIPMRIPAEYLNQTRAEIDNQIQQLDSIRQAIRSGAQIDSDYLYLTQEQVEAHTEPEIRPSQPTVIIDEVRIFENSVDGSRGSANMNVSSQSRSRNYMPISNRTFGVELEIINIDASRAAQVICDAGIHCKVENYGHSVPRHWKIVTDASVRNRNGVYGVEVVSPLLSGEQGLEQVRTVCKALAAAGATVNKTCGLHVHVDARNANLNLLRTLIKRYGQFENTIDCFVPQSRRASNNEFCESVSRRLENIRNNHGNSFELATDVHQLRQAFVSYAYRDRRYAKINIECFFRQGSVEFRQHSGTLNAEKAANWVRFAVAFYEESQRRANLSAPTQAVATGRAPRGCASSSARGAVFYDSLEDAIAVRPAFTGRYSTRMGLRNLYTQLVSGVPTSQIASMLGISSDSVPGYISNMRRKFNLNIVKIRANDTYRLAQSTTASRTNARQTVQAQSNVPADTWTAGQDPEVINYFMERATDFGFEMA